MASIHAMLRNLAEKVDRVGGRAGDEGLDALEKQVMSLADRLDARSADPTLASLETDHGRSAAAGLGAAREAPIEAAVAARHPQRRRPDPRPPASHARPRDQSEFGLLRAGLADMQARQVASDQRLATTLQGVQSALERLLVRLGPSAGRHRHGAPSLDERLIASTESSRRPRAPRRGAARSRRRDLDEAPRLGRRSARARQRPADA